MFAANGFAVPGEGTVQHNITFCRWGLKAFGLALLGDMNGGSSPWMGEAHEVFSRRGETPWSPHRG